jgi:hypothetical protein
VTTLLALERVRYRDRQDAQELAQFNRELEGLKRLGGHGGNAS